MAIENWSLFSDLVTWGAENNSKWQGYLTSSVVQSARRLTQRSYRCRSQVTVGASVLGECATAANSNNEALRFQKNVETLNVEEEIPGSP